jgi:hypothetical protein
MKKIKVKGILAALVGILVLIGVIDQSQGDKITHQVETIVPEDAGINIDLDKILDQDTETEVASVISKISRSVLKNVTSGSGAGVVQATQSTTTYRLEAQFENLPELEDGFFYEGWIVRRNLANRSVLSTGPATKTIGGFTNIFTAEEKLFDHDFYVLTLEPDDGDPAPADHVLEGVLK